MQDAGHEAVANALHQNRALLGDAGYGFSSAEN
jgi:hypothetical protein